MEVENSWAQKKERERDREGERESRAGPRTTLSNQAVQYPTPSLLFLLVFSSPFSLILYFFVLLVSRAREKTPIFRRFSIVNAKRDVI